MSCENDFVFSVIFNWWFWYLLTRQSDFLDNKLFDSCKSCFQVSIQFMMFIDWLLRKYFDNFVGNMLKACLWLSWHLWLNKHQQHNEQEKIITKTQKAQDHFINGIHKNAQNDHYNTNNAE